MKHHNNRKLCWLVSGLLLSAAGTALSDDLDKRVDRIERQAARVAPLTLDVQTLKRENQHLRGQVEEQQHAIRALQRKLQDMYLDLDQRISSGVKASVPATAAGPAVTPVISAEPVAPLVAGIPVGDRPVTTVVTTVTSVTTAAPADPVAEKAAYDAAYALLGSKQRKYDEAIKAFDQFLVDYPQSGLADNAMYWKAEASYVLGDNVAALAAFEALINTYPSSAKQPGALLKTGYILHADGQSERAAAVLERLVQDYPASSASDMAQKRLDRISRETR